MTFHRDKNKAICYRNRFYTNTYRDDLVNYVLFRMAASAKPLPDDISDLLKQYRADILDISHYVFVHMSVPASVSNGKKTLCTPSQRHLAEKYLAGLTNKSGIGKKQEEKDGKITRGDWVEETWDNFRDEE